ILVMLNRVERHRKRQVRELRVDAVLLVDRHLVLFEIEVGNALLQQTDQQVMGQPVLAGKAGGGDGFNPFQERFVRLMAQSDSGERIIGKLVVVAIVAKGGGALRLIAQVGLILLLKKSVLGGEMLGNRFVVLGENGDRGEYEEQVKVHMCVRVPEKGFVETEKVLATAGTG